MVAPKKVAEAVFAVSLSFMEPHVIRVKANIAVIIDELVSNPNNEDMPGTPVGAAILQDN